VIPWLTGKRAKPKKRRLRRAIRTLSSYIADGDILAEGAKVFVGERILSDPFPIHKEGVFVATGRQGDDGAPNSVPIGVREGKRLPGGEVPHDGYGFRSGRGDHEQVGVPLGDRGWAR
jgi:hypothetical protein